MPVRILYRMTVCDLKKGERAVVLRVDLSGDEQARLRFLNVYKGANLTLLKVSRFKKTWLIQARSAKFAVRREIAEGIRVWRT